MRVVAKKFSFGNIRAQKLRHNAELDKVCYSFTIGFDYIMNGANLQIDPFATFFSELQWNLRL